MCPGLFPASDEPRGGVANTLTVPAVPVTDEGRYICRTKHGFNASMSSATLPIP